MKKGMTIEEEEKYLEQVMAGREATMPRWHGTMPPKSPKTGMKRTPVSGLSKRARKALPA